MITENLSTLKIHKLTQAQYDRELESGNIDANALYLTPDDASNIKQIETNKNDIATLKQDVESYESLTLGKHSDGLIYIFKNGSPIGNGLEIQANVVEGDVFGYVDENNVIVLNGALAEGTYTIKYEMDDGSTVEIGNLVLDNNVYYSITNNLTNCTNSNNTVQMVEGGSYSATISANDGYELSSVMVTMGGTDISSSVVSGGKITIANVTGDIVITATATEIQTEPVEPTNFAVPNATNKTDWSIWCNDARFGSDGGYRQLKGNIVTNYVPMEVGDIIRFEGLNVATTGESMNNGMYFSDADKAVLSCANIEFYTQDRYNYLSVTVTDGVYEIDTSGLSKHERAKNSKFFRISGSLTGTVDDVVINVKRNGKWL